MGQYLRCRMVLRGTGWLHEDLRGVSRLGGIGTRRVSMRCTSWEVFSGANVGRPSLSMCMGSGSVSVGREVVCSGFEGAMIGFVVVSSPG